MQFQAVADVLDALDACHVRYWVAGGWGIAILVGAQTREHRDLDLAIDATDVGLCLAALDSLGYVPETDWMPIRLELRAPGARWVDVHPIEFDRSGRGRQAARNGEYFDYPPTAFTDARLNGRLINCLSVQQQRTFHTGYPHQAKDVHDLAQLDLLGS